MFYELLKNQQYFLVKGKEITRKFYNLKSSIILKILRKNWKKEKRNIFKIYDIIKISISNYEIYKKV